MGKKEFLKSVICNINSSTYWLLVGLVRSLKSSHKEALRKPLLCEDYNDLTSPTSNQISDIHIAVSVLYDTFKKFLYEHLCSYCLILHFNYEMKLSVLLHSLQNILETKI